MEFRRIFDTIPEQFDRYRPRYSAELFSALIDYARIGPGKSVLELGPGTGQATDPSWKRAAITTPSSWASICMR